MLNVDTHVLLYAVTGALTPRETRLLSADRWSISAIVLWEIANLAQLGRITVDLDDPEVVGPTRGYEAHTIDSLDRLACRADVPAYSGALDHPYRRDPITRTGRTRSPGPVSASQVGT